MSSVHHHVPKVQGSPSPPLSPAENERDCLEVEAQGKPELLLELLVTSAATRAGSLGEARELESSDFSDLRTRAVFAVMRQLDDVGRRITAAAVACILSQGEPLGDPGGWARYVAWLAEFESTSALLGHHVRALRRLSRRRAIKNLARKVLADDDGSDDRQRLAALLVEPAR